MLGEKGEDLVLEVPLGITIEHQNKIIGRFLELSNEALKLLSIAEALLLIRLKFLNCMPMAMILLPS